MSFKIFANALVLEPDFNPVQRGFKKNANVGVTSSFDIKSFSPKDYLFSHCTIIASVDTDPDCEHHITSSTEKYINQNNDSWSRGVVKNSYRTFIGAPNYVEHVQVPELSKGTIVDAVLRDIKGETLYCDILVATSRKHDELIHRIKTGSMKAMSMGCIAAYTYCTKCGNKAHNEQQLCDHIKYSKGSKFLDKKGNLMSVAELCGHEKDPESVKFIEASWVEVPAFTGAVLRNVINIESPILQKVSKMTGFLGLQKTAANRSGPQPLMGDDYPPTDDGEFGDDGSVTEDDSLDKQEADLQTSLQELFGDKDANLEDGAEDDSIKTPSGPRTRKDLEDNVQLSTINDSIYKD